MITKAPVRVSLATVQMARVAAPPLTEAEARLLLTQLLSPAFPVGSYAYSQGLETAMAAGKVHDAATLTDWTQGVLLYGSGRIDAILIAHARDPDTNLKSLADLACAYAPSAERAMEMRDQGMAFALLARALGLEVPTLPYAVALGAATANLPLQSDEILALYLQALAAQLTSAAVRFLPLAATEGQVVVARLAPLITTLAHTCAVAPLTALASATFGADHATMAHETLQPRLFRS